MVTMGSSWWVIFSLTKECRTCWDLGCHSTASHHPCRVRMIEKKQCWKNRSGPKPKLWIWVTRNTEHPRLKCSPPYESPVFALSRVDITVMMMNHLATQIQIIRTQFQIVFQFILDSWSSTKKQHKSQVWFATIKVMVPQGSPHWPLPRAHDRGCSSVQSWPASALRHAETCGGTLKKSILGGLPKMGVPNNGWFRGTPIYGHPHMVLLNPSSTAGVCMYQFNGNVLVQVHT